ncbi:MAG: glycosyltransferase family 1 protein [Candidatus Hydrogenedentota bacterium]|nr:MAG: glycosyltransferase family 1 protein [Candidatus Hydrogenedentota bacterium]
MRSPHRNRYLHIITKLELGGAQVNTILSACDALRRGHEVFVAAAPGELSKWAREKLGVRLLELNGGSLRIPSPDGADVFSSDRFSNAFDALAKGEGAATEKKTTGGTFVNHEGKGTTEEGRRAKREEPAAEEGRETAEYVLPGCRLVRPVHPAADIGAFFGLRRLIRLLRPDLVHTHSSKAGILGRLAAASSGCDCAVIHTVHGWGFHSRQPAVTRRLFVASERVAARVTDRILVVAEANRRRGLECGIGTPSQYRVVRSGISLDREGLRARRMETRRILGIPPQDLVVVWVGNFKEQKNPEGMYEAARILTMARKDTWFLAVGGGTRQEAYLSRARRDGLHRVLLPGWRRDAAAIIASADLFFHTAWFEGLPRAVLEAQALGIPVVSTNVDGIPEAVAEGRTGFLFPPGEIRRMAAKALELLGNPELRRRMGEAAAREFREEFTLEAMLRELDRIYEEVLAERRAGRGK